MLHMRRNLWLSVFLLNLTVSLTAAGSNKASADWEPPSKISRAQIIDSSKAVLNMHDMKIREYEEIFRIRVLAMDWDIGVMVYEPEETKEEKAIEEAEPAAAELEDKAEQIEEASEEEEVASPEEKAQTEEETREDDQPEEEISAKGEPGSLESILADMKKKGQKP